METTTATRIEQTHKLTVVCMCLLLCLFPGVTKGTSSKPVQPSSQAAVGSRGLDTVQAERFARLSLHCATREYPYKLGQVLGSQGDLKAPRQLHPAFYGCFDWHSAVHGHWSMVRLLKRFPKMKAAPAIIAVLNRHLTLAHITQEAVFFRNKYHKTFERPYGWGWFLRLAAELHTWKAPMARPWRASLQPLERLLLKKIPSYLKRLTVPVRAGTHASTAFALVHIFDYAVATNNASLQQAITIASRRFYGNDRSCPTAYEPSGEDFISPCLAEADLMRRVLQPAAFRAWLKGFLPPITSEAFRTVREPPQIRDRKDYKIGHLVGLLLQRSWSLRGIASSLPPKDPRKARLQKAARLHRIAAHQQLFTSGYGGKHWLASFAIYDLTGAGIPNKMSPTHK